MPRRVHGCGCDTENKTVAGSKILSLPLIVDKPLVCQRGLPGRLSSHCSSIQHGRPTPSHRPALTLARCSAPADFASLRVLGAPAASRPPLLTSSLVALPASLGLLRPVSRTARGLRAPRRRRPSVPALRTACARAFSPSGLHLFASICIHSSQSSICIARKLACSSRCSLGSLRPVSFLNSQ